MNITFEQLKGFLTTLNAAHRTRFPGLSKGQQVRARLANGEILAGEIETLSADGLTVNNGQSVAGGHNASTTVAWIEVIEIL